MNIQMELQTKQGTMFFNCVDLHEAEQALKWATMVPTSGAPEKNKEPQQTASKE